MELEAGVAAAEHLQVGGGAVLGGGVDVAEGADRAAAGERPDLGADHVIEGEDRAMLGRGGRGTRRLP